MISTLNAKQLAIMYQMGYSTFQQYITPHRKHIQLLATKRTGPKGNVIRSKNYNSLQLQYIIETVMGDTPQGYIFTGESLVKEA